VTERMVNGVPAVTSKQELTDLTGKSRYVGGRVKRLAGASLRQKAMSSGLRSWSSAAVTGKPDAVKVARPVWSGGKTARSYLSLPCSDARSQADRFPLPRTRLGWASACAGVAPAQQQGQGPDPRPPRSQQVRSLRREGGLLCAENGLAVPNP